jgi:hypothetical protein
LLGIKILSSISWEPENADVSIYCNASIEGIGFWYPDHMMAFYAPVPLQNAGNIIFYFEA